MKKTKVLIVDDSAIVRKILSDAISAAADLEVVGTAPDPYIARDKILALKPDVLTLDIEMPRMDGLTFLKKLMDYRPMPVIMITSLAQSSCEVALEALGYGAVEVLAKPGGPYSVGELRFDLPGKIRAAAASRIPAAAEANDIVRRQRRTTHRPGVFSPFHPDSVLAIGASTGGTEAIQTVLMDLPANGRGIVIAQHIPPVFSRAFAERLNRLCPMEVREARDGDAVVPGVALVAPGNLHMKLCRIGAAYEVRLDDGPQVHYQRPSVDILFQSVAEAAGPHATGVLLTGMGKDGAAGLLQMKRAGARTIAQDEATCVVFGMPGEAVKLEAADEVLPVTEIAQAICSPAFAAH